MPLRRYRWGLWPVNFSNLTSSASLSGLALVSRTNWSVAASITRCRWFMRTMKCFRMEFFYFQWLNIRNCGSHIIVNFERTSLIWLDSDRSILLFRLFWHYEILTTYMIRSVWWSPKYHYWSDTKLAIQPLKKRPSHYREENAFHLEKIMHQVLVDDLRLYVRMLKLERSMFTIL